VSSGIEAPWADTHITEFVLLIMQPDRHLISHHFGPDPKYVGGMGTVIRVIDTYRVGADEVVVHPTWRPQSFLTNCRLTWKAIQDIRKMPKNSLAHFHLSERGSFVREGLLVAVAHQHGIKTIVSIHGADFVQFAQTHRLLVSKVLKRTDVITCLDPEVLALVLQIAPHVYSVVLPNPVPMDDGSSTADETDELIVFAGEIGTRKGVDVLYQAWQRIAKVRQGARCVIAGPNGDFDLLSDERLEVRQPLNASEMRTLLREARVVVLPSRAEGMPMVLTEAMSAGRPFVSTPIGGIPDLARAGGGFLVEVGSPDELAARVSQLLADPMLAKRMGEFGRQFCRETRSVEVIGERLRQVYLGVI
jgi:glycosyltransferase involved in cell wall biosynthesis